MGEASAGARWGDSNCWGGFTYFCLEMPSFNNQLRAGERGLGEPEEEPGGGQSYCMGGLIYPKKTNTHHSTTNENLFIEPSFPGSMTNVEYRHPTIDDVKAITDVSNRNAREIPLHQDNTVEETLAFTFKEDDYDPKGFLLAIIDGEIVGYGGSMIHKHRIEMGKDDAWIGIAIVPEKRNIGIEQHFMKFGLDYLRSRKIGTAKRGCYGLEGWRHDIGLEYGFKDVRHSYTMVWKHDKAPEAIPPPEDITLEHIMFKEASDDDAARFVDNFNTSFFDHYDFSKALVKDFIKWRELDREKTRMTFAKDGQDIVGVLMYEVSLNYNKDHNEKIGWANILGVNPEHRKNGIGRTLLSTGMRWIYDQGMDTIYLGMDAENAKALDLYTSLGYEIHKESVNYSLEL